MSAAIPGPYAALYPPSTAVFLPAPTLAKPNGLIQTFTGRFVRPLDLRSADISLQDIAHALAQQCRFSGHTSTFYSVAQHSVLASLMVAKVGSLSDQLWALMHDASEAYLVDLPSPLKKSVPFGKGYRAAERKAMVSICEAFNLPLDEPPLVKWADRQLVLMEKRDLMPDSPPWAEDEISKEKIIPWSAELAKTKFLWRYDALTS